MREEVAMFDLFGKTKKLAEDARALAESKIVELGKRVDALLEENKVIPELRGRITKFTQEVLELVASRDEMQEKLRKANVKLESIAIALSEYKPSTSFLKSNKALRMELDSASSAIDKAKELLNQ